MIGLHTNGVHIFGGSSELWQKLKKLKVEKAEKITSTTLVFAVNSFKLLEKRYYATSFQGGETPWFLCRTKEYEEVVCEVDDIKNIENMLTFDNEDDIVLFITAIYYSVKGALHLDYDVLEFKNYLQQKENAIIKSYKRDNYKNMPNDKTNWTFAFVDGGFMASDTLFQELTNEVGVFVPDLRMVGNFSSKFDLVVSFVLE